MIRALGLALVLSGCAHKAAAGWVGDPTAAGVPAIATVEPTADAFDALKQAGATGLLAGINAARLHQHEEPLTLPQTTMLGALCRYVTHADLKDFQPMKANFGILPTMHFRPKSGKRERGQLYADRALRDLELALNGDAPAIINHVYANL